MSKVSVNGKPIKLHGVECRFFESAYNNGRKAIYLRDEFDREYMVLTVNVPQYTELGEDEFLVKTWSENETSIGQILTAGYFIDTKKRVRVGFSEAAVWAYSPSFINEVQDRQLEEQAEDRAHRIGVGTLSQIAVDEVTVGQLRGWLENHEDSTIVKIYNGYGLPGLYDIGEVYRDTNRGDGTKILVLGVSQD